MDVDEAVAELYRLPLDDFVAARNELAKKARSEGAADVARQVKALTKPTVAAWLVNQLAHRHRDEMDQLVDLGEQMRDAAAAHDGRRLRDLTSERNDVVQALMRHTRELASDAGVRMTDDSSQLVADTLHAAMADSRAADLVRSGRLARTLQHVGYGAVGGDDGSADVISLAEARSARRRERQPAKEAEPERGDRSQRDTDRRRAEARRQLAEAESGLDTATGLVAELTDALDRHQRQLDEAEETVRELTERLEEARQEARDAQAAIRRDERGLDKARRAVDVATRAKQEAERLLELIDQRAPDSR